MENIGGYSVGVTLSIDGSSLSLADRKTLETEYSVDTGIGIGQSARVQIVYPDRTVDINIPVIYTPEDNRIIFGFIQATCSKYVFQAGKLYGILEQKTEFPDQSLIDRYLAKAAMCGISHREICLVDYKGTKMVTVPLVQDQNGKSRVMGAVFYNDKAVTLNGEEFSELLMQLYDYQQGVMSDSLSCMEI